jgi:transposase
VQTRTIPRYTLSASGSSSNHSKIAFAKGLSLIQDSDALTQYEKSGLDVSMEETNVCVLDQEGNMIFEGAASSRPGAIAKVLRRRAPNAERVVFETGSLSNWLWHELKALGFPVLCLDARHTKAALSMRMNKSDRNDARGLAEMARMGWYREARVKSMESREIRAVLAARAKLVDLRRDIENQMRGLLKGLGIVLGKAGSKTLSGKNVVVLRGAPHLRPLIHPLLLAHSALATQITKYDELINRAARANPTVHRLMTVPGVGPVTALAFASTSDDPKRFKAASDVGAYLGLTPRRYQSGQLDRTGRISNRTALFTLNRLWWSSQARTAGCLWVA